MVAGGVLVAVLLTQSQPCGQPDAGSAQREDDCEADGEMLDLIFSYLHVRMPFERRLNGVKTTAKARETSP